MKKAELKAIAERYGMGILREEITDKAIGLYLETEEDIPELDELLNPQSPHEAVVATKLAAPTCTMYTAPQAGLTCGGGKTKARKAGAFASLVQVQPPHLGGRSWVTPKAERRNTRWKLHWQSMPNGTDAHLPRYVKRRIAEALPPRIESDATGLSTRRSRWWTTAGS